MSPDGSRALSPEERLLRLIRKGPQAAAPAQPAGAGTPPGKAGAKRRRAPAAWSRQWFVALNIGLGCVVLGEATAFVMMWAAPVPVTPVVIPPPPTPAVRPEQLLEPPVETIASAATQPLFREHTVSQPVDARPAKPAGLSEDAKAVASRLSLIGMVDGEPPQAIIEDTQTQKSYFVSAGQPVVEGWVVDEIKENRVTLTLGDERIELAL